jgi:hypothetical protein
MAMCSRLACDGEKATRAEKMFDEVFSKVVLCYLFGWLDLVSVREH